MTEVYKVSEYPRYTGVTFQGMDVFSSMLAGLLFLSGAARGAVAPIGDERAEQLLTNYDELSSEYDQALRAYECKAVNRSELTEVLSDLSACRAEVKGLLSDQVDWRDRALRREDRDERDACVLGQYEDLVRRLCGPVSPDPSHLANLVDGLQGSVESAALQRDEQAAFALMLLEHLRRLPTSEMSEGIENAHHAVCASPRTAESEERSIALLESQVSVRVLAKIRHHMEYAERLVEVQQLEREHHRWQRLSLESDLAEARTWCLRLLFIGGISGMATASALYGALRFFS